MHNSVGSAMQQRVENAAEKRIIIIDNIVDLPDDIVINILSRLPAVDVVRCRCVCREWRDLTSTQQFVNIQLNRQLTTPSILVDIRERLKAFNLIDNWWEAKEAILEREVFVDFPHRRVLLSQNGLILFRYPINPLQLFILNPINGERVIIKFPRDMWRYYRAYGVYVHPTLKEYCTLGELNGKYKLLVTGPTSYVRDIDNPLCGKDWAVRTPPPILVNDHLYWMAEPELSNGNYDIVEFDIKSEEFVLIPSPFPKALVSHENVCQLFASGRCGLAAFYSIYGNLGLLTIDGLVSIVQISTEENLVITIWTLKDRLRKLWTTSCYSNITTQGCQWQEKLRAIAFAHGELFICSAGKMFVCNLKSKTMRSFGNVNFDYKTSFVPHVMTLASLRNNKFDKLGERTRPFPQTAKLEKSQRKQVEIEFK